MYICKVFRKGLNADKFYLYFDFQCIIKIHNFVFVHFKSSCKYQLTGKTMTSKVLIQNNQDAENVMHLSNFCQRIVSDNFKSVFNDVFYRNCRNFPGSMITFRFAKWVAHKNFQEDFMTFF